jgi:hypothetical protein
MIENKSPEITCEVKMAAVGATQVKRASILEPTSPKVTSRRSSQSPRRLKSPRPSIIQSILRRASVKYLSVDPANPPPSDTLNPPLLNSLNFEARKSFSGFSAEEDGSRRISQRRHTAIHMLDKPFVDTLAYRRLSCSGKDVDALMNDMASSMADPIFTKIGRLSSYKSSKH